MAKSEVARDKANARWQKNPEKSKMDECSGILPAMQAISHKPIDTSSLRSDGIPARSKQSKFESLRPDGVSETLWRDFEPIAKPSVPDNRNSSGRLPQRSPAGRSVAFRRHSDFHRKQLAGVQGRWLKNQTAAPRRACACSAPPGLSRNARRASGSSEGNGKWPQKPTILDSLEALFSAFPAGDRGDNVQAIRAYLMAVEDIQPRLVAMAVRRFIRGDVERDRHAFCPVAPELAIEARRLEKQADVEARLAARAALPKPQVEPSKPKTAEEREKVAALHGKPRAWP